MTHRPLNQRLLAGAALGLGLWLAQPHAASAQARLGPALDRLEIDVTRAEDVKAIESLQRAYGHYADRGLWEDLADLFTDDATADYPSGVFIGKPSIRKMFIENLGAGKPGLAEGRIYNHIILQPVVDLAPDGKTATGRWRVLGMLGRLGGTASWADSLYRFDYVKRDGKWKIISLITYAGSGGGYENGWTLPKPRPPGYVDRSPVTFNLAHPADKPRGQSCDDASICVVPFPYPNRGGIKASPADVSAVVDPRPDRSDKARAADLVGRAQRLADEKSVLNLQRAYGYYLDRAMWSDVANLFAPDGTRESGLAGVYVGRDHIRRSLEQRQSAGIRNGQIRDHLQIEPIVTVAPDGKTAKARVLELAMIGGAGTAGVLVQNIEENDFVRRGGVWMIKAVHSYAILATDSEQGWGKSALPAPAISTTFPPDRPPSVAYEPYPKIYTPLFHFPNPSTGKPAQYAPNQTPAGQAEPDAPAQPASLGAGPLGPRVAAAERQVQRVLDYNAIENLQDGYGYYAEKSLWSEIPSLFAADGALVDGGGEAVGHDKILAALRASGPDGPVKDSLNSLLQLQPVIDVAPDGRTAKIRSRLLQLARDDKGRPIWGGGIYENQLVKEDGVWKFKRFHLYRTYRLTYKGGWAKPQAGEGQVIPSSFTPPFHYANPVARR